jgi:hypothetical protein
VQPTDELEALQIRLIKAQIKEAELSNRILGQLWFQRCLRGVLFWGFLFWLLTHFIGGALIRLGTSRSFYNERGSFAGSSITRGKTTNYYNARGSVDGTSINLGRSTSHYDGRGRFIGSTINTGPRR